MLAQTHMAHGPPRPPGIARHSSFRTRCPDIFRSNGFSLIELLVVIAVIAAALLMVLPRLPALDGYYLDSDAGRLAAIVNFTSERAAARKSYYRLSFDFRSDTALVEVSPDGKEYTAETDPSLKGFRLSRGISFVEISSPGLGKVKEGEAAIVFSPTGSEPFELKLAAGSRVRIVSFNPYTGRAAVKDEAGVK